jgi:hypothetical protein
MKNHAASGTTIRGRGKIRLRRAPRSVGPYNAFQAMFRSGRLNRRFRTGRYEQAVTWQQRRPHLCWGKELKPSRRRMR